VSLRFVQCPQSRPQQHVMVVSGLSNKGPDNVHETGATGFLTGVPPRRTQGSEPGAGVPVDQVVAGETARHTQLGGVLTVFALPDMQS